MKIDYIRKLMTSHMIIDAAGVLEAWEEKMIAHAVTPRILFGESVKNDGVGRLWYDITGMQSLDVLLETESLGAELLGRILTGIYEAVEELERALLREDELLLLPECIFLDYRTEQLVFCYYPGGAPGMAESFIALMEYLLTKLDHSDGDVVNMAYNIYEHAVKVKGEGSLGEIKCLLRIPYEREDLVETDETEYTECSEKLKKTEFSEKIEKMEHMDSMASYSENQLEDEQGHDFTKKVVSRWNLRSLLERIRGKWENEVGIKQRKTEKQFVFEPEDEEPQAAARPTVLLSEMAKTPEGVLRYEGRGNLKDMVITGEMFVIGSGPECGGRIECGTVSRKHARIIRKEGIYFIEDLNSSNGTYVGGELLNYKTKASLQKNEIVMFADEKFRFI